MIEENNTTIGEKIMENMEKVQQSVEVKKIGKTKEFLLPIPIHVGERYGVEKGDRAFVFVNELDNGISIMYKILKGEDN